MSKGTMWPRITCFRCTVGYSASPHCQVHGALVWAADDVLADAKVTQGNVAIVLQEHILWLDVSVSHALLVCVSNGLGQLPHG